jgi:hypothetical protein
MYGPYSDDVYAIFARRYDRGREAKENIIYIYIYTYICCGVT